MEDDGDEQDIDNDDDDDDDDKAALIRGFATLSSKVALMESLMVV